jgi:ATP-dependent RNA helicase DHX37/DHR1
MEEIHKLRGQISNIVQANFSDADADFLAKISPPDAFQVCLHFRASARRH